MILEPLKKPPFDVKGWVAALDQYRDIPFMKDGRDQGTIIDANAKADLA